MLHNVTQPPTKTFSPRYRLDVEHIPKRLRILAVSRDQGRHFGSPYNKDHSKFEFILGRLFVEAPYWI